MAFNPFVTFQRNRRFWMAAILMICMISFVFCTGLKGDMGERLGWMFSGSRGDTVFKLDGRSYGAQQVRELRLQRKLANKLMLNCSDAAFKKVQKEFFELGKKKEGPANAKDAEAREQKLLQLEGVRQVIGQRKSRKEYFEIGTKFDDLVEFAMWQNIADKLGIRLEEEHVDLLYIWEFFYMLDRNELGHIETLTLRDFRDANPTFVRKAITEEFRVRMAQEAYLTAQPFAFFGRKRQTEGLGPKFTTPEIPDEVRAPLTLSQLWDSYKKNRQEFEVVLLPIDVGRYLDKIKEKPSEAEKVEYYKEHRDKAVDPNSDIRGLVQQQKIKVEYVYADPTSPAYLESAKLVDRLRVVSPVATDTLHGPLAGLTQLWAANEIHRAELQGQYDSLGRNEQASYWTAPYTFRDCVTPILSHYAKKHPEAAVSVIGNAFLSPQDPIGVWTGYLAWGAMGRPSGDEKTREAVRKTHEDEVDAVLQAEMKRRAPLYAVMFAASTSPFPLNSAAPFLAVSPKPTPFPGIPFFDPIKLPVEAVRKELEDMSARRAAEEKAQQNMQIVRAALDKVDGDAEKFKRELNKLVPELKLTYGPAADKKGVFFNRHTLAEAEELKPLREVFLHDITMINLFEGRDLTPERLLKPTDFYKMFFESAEMFSATSNHRAMPWPPRVKPNAARVWKAADPRLINRDKLDPRAAAVFDEHLKQQNPLAPAPMFDDLFKNASKPILFWRTGKRDPVALPGKYEDIAPLLKKIEDEWKENDQAIKKFAELAPQIDKLRKEEANLKKAKADATAIKAVQAKLEPLLATQAKLEEEVGGKPASLIPKQAALKEDEADLKEVERLVIEGWKFERARSAEAIPVAKQAAETLIKNGNQPFALSEQLGVPRITVPRLCRMYPEKMPDGSIDYGKPPLPKDKIPFPRDDTIDELVNLYDLDAAIKIGNKELDDINKELYELVRKGENPRGRFVQILANKPRSTYYVAFVSKPPEAKKDEFVLSLRGAPHPFDEFAMMQFRMFPRDHFVERIQQQSGKEFRRGIVGIDALKASFGYELINDKEKQNIDGAVGD